MTVALFLASVLVAPQPAAVGVALATHEFEYVAGWTQDVSAEDVRIAYRLVLQSSSVRAKPDPIALSPRLLTVYAAIEMAPKLSHAEKRRMRAGLELRLEQMAAKLTRLKRQLERSARTRLVTDRSSRLSRDTNAASALSGTEAQNVANLIEVIQTTIAPDSWDINGGKGSVYYYAPLRVLVVRQSGGVHHQIGGVIDQLKQ